jgi:uncharacterized protein (TIGR03437 family)
MYVRIAWLGLAASLCAWAQPVLNPVIQPRGVINAYTQQPAPSVVAPGGLIWINGLNLGPAAPLAGEGPVWPAELGGVQVLVNNRPAPLLSVSPARIVAQVPWETPNGQMNVLVRRGEASSRAARIMVQNPLPAVPTRSGTGIGELAATDDGQTLRFSASGLGQGEPRLATGEAGPDGAVPLLPVSVHVGGLRVEAKVTASAARPGEFTIEAPLPESALRGDVVTVEAGNRLANLATWRSTATAEVSFLPLPEGTPELRGINASDLRGGFLIGSGARTAEGCWPSVLIDLRARQSRRIDECLTAANANAPSPVTPTQNGGAMAALVGPPANSDAAQGVSRRAMLFHPGRPAAMEVELPGVAVTLTGGAGGNFAAVLAGTPLQVASINSATGEVSNGGGGGLLGGIGGGGAGAPGQALNPLTLTVDAGNGLNKVLTIPVNAGQQQVYVVVGDSEDTPTAAKLAILNPQGAIQATRDFPEGWVPLVPPAAPANPGGGGGPVGPGGPGGGPGGPIVIPPGGGGAIANPLARFRLPAFFDAQTRTYFVLARRADDSRHALLAFTPTEARALPTPDGSFVAVCSNSVQIASIETSRRLVLLGSRQGDRTFRATCGAGTFLMLDLAGRRADERLGARG